MLTDDQLTLLLGGLGVLALGVLAASVLVKPAYRRKPGGGDAKGVLAVAAATVFIVGTFSWRTRTAAQLNSAPVDAAGAIRLVADGGALALATFSFWSRRVDRAVRTGIASVTWLYGAYIVLAVLGAVMAVEPQIVLFRVFDLGVCLIVGVALAQAFSLEQVMAFWRRTMWVISALIIGSALAVPSLGFEEARGGIVPFRLQGVFPSFSANTVGFVGTMLIVLALGQGRVRKPSLALGLALVILSQYRTGYVALAAVLILYVLIRGSALRKLALVLCAPLGYVLVQSAFVADAFVRGEVASQSLETLSGRTNFWAVAIDVASRSPIIGTGLSSGTRNEVLAGRLDMTETSTIHGTWIEAYVGTGILGTAALLLFAAAAGYYAWRVRALTVAPVLIVAAMLVRSLTGTSIELASIMALLFFTVALACEMTVRTGRADDQAAVPSNFFQAVPSEKMGSFRSVS